MPGESSAAQTAAPEGLPVLGPGRRALGLGLAWAALLLGGPGVLSASGGPFGPLVFAALWSTIATRPGRRAWLVEWLLASLGFGVVMWWLSYISWAVVPPAGIGMGAYAALAGALARRSVRIVPLPLAAASAWVALETLRDLVEPPFGMGWLRLGHHVGELEWLAGSARAWGVAGVSFVLVVVGAGAACAVRPTARGGRLVGATWALGALVAAVGLSRVGVPETEPGPTVLLVQPNIAQDRKQRGLEDDAIIQAQLDLTVEGVREEPVDLVCWSETMLRVPLLGPGLEQAVENGARFDPWLSVEGMEREFVEWAAVQERELVRRRLLGLDGRSGVLRDGTAFLAGTEEWRAVDGRIRRLNSAALWSADGERRARSKRHLVPLGETMWGLEQFAWGRAVVGGYIADLHGVRDEEPLVFADRDGRTWRVGTPICFDNAFLDAFDGHVDFHVVLSNEAWYRTSIELDQMLAFTRLASIASGRATARCTNSGVSFACDARGRTLAHLVVDGRDREVAGALRVELPVPVDPSAATLFGRFGHALRWALVALGLVLGLVARSARDAA